MDEKTYITVTTIIFVLVAVAHLLRALLGWQLSIAGWAVPTWFSWVGLIIAGFIAYSGYCISKQG